MIAREVPKGSHPIDREELMAYLDGELQGDRAAMAVTHLESCRECKRFAADLRTTSARLREWQVAPSHEPLATGVAAALAELDRKTRSAAAVRPWRRVSPWTWGFAALGILVMVIAVSLRNTPQYKTLSRESMSLGRPHFERLESFTRLPKPRAVANDGFSEVETAPMIVRRSQLVLTTNEFGKARADLDEALHRRHGYNGELNVSSPPGSGHILTATLRVPADQLDGLMAEVRKLGRVESETQSGEDVERQYVDLEARLSNAQNTEQRLTDLLRERTGKLSDVLSVEVEISRVRGEIERMQAERKNLTNQVSFATLNITLTEEYRGSTSTRFRNTAVSGYRFMVGGLVNALVFLVAIAPSVLIWGALLFFPVRFAWRRWKSLA